jgi:UDP-N-acetylmuramate--alanine ligase
MDNIFRSVRKVHLIGIGGIGMSGIAEYLARKGFDVRGSDIIISPITRRLSKFGVQVFEGHSENNVNDDTELVIYTSAVKEDNPEYLKAKRLGKKIIKRAKALGNIVNDKFVIAVSGTHGKTTTTAMIAKVLIENRNDPTVFVGGNIDFLDGGSSRIGKSNIAIVEADEYDKSFLQISSDIIVITNIESDHLDIFKDIEDIKNNFRKFVDNSKKDSKIIACGDDENVTDVLKDFRNKTLYGFKKSNDMIITEAGYGKNSASYRMDGDFMRIKVLGEHNILNSAAAYLVGKEFNVTDEAFNETMKTFHGVKRRLDLKFDNGIKIYDDYAHHPTEVKVTLNAIRKTNPGRIITVFQPHLYSRTRDFYKEFGEAFSGTDILLLAKIYPAREKEIPGVSSNLILTEYNKLNKEGKYIEDNEKILDELDSITREGDVIIFQGAGDINNLSSRYVKILKTKSNWTIPL